MMHIEAAATYVNITREDFEDWLDTQDSRWKLKPQTRGIYQIPLSASVAVEVSSTLGSSGSNMGRGNASMSMKLVSTVTGQTLNKKAQGQKYFTRTQNWRTNLSKGVQRLKNAYLGARSFYEAVAEIADREVYREEVLSEIHSIPDWTLNRDLVAMETKVSSGGILMKKQRAQIAQIASDKSWRKSKPDPVGFTAEQERFLDRLRRLYQEAKRSGDEWTMNFAKDIGVKLQRGGYTLSPKQRELIKKKLREYNV